MDAARARELEASDPVPSLRDEFHVPDGWAYLAGNSLGLQPRTARAEIETELDEWARLGVEGWFESREPWLEYAGSLRASVGRLVGAAEEEVALMNTLTVNLHLLLATFYRPTPERFRILIEEDAFPSDSYAVQSQAAWHGFDPAEAVVRVPVAGIADAVERLRDSLAVALLPGVNYLSGEVLDVQGLTAAVHEVGAVSAWDLAHAIGNVPVELHDAGADFAFWCNYKYLNAGPGAPGGAFVHERHGSRLELPRLAGWWGNDPAVRFRMEPGFEPRPGAEGWAVSTPPVLAFAPLRASLEQFDRVGLDLLRDRSVRLTGYLEELLDEVAASRPMTVITPRERDARGCQLSVSCDGARSLAGRLRAEHGVVCDFREPDVLRFAPTPLYNTYQDCYRAAAALLDVLA
ncbi:MAG TPA: kynureninase [Gaiellaceae bacterium]|nr:kynureninase [Gaiellaceae bacterium]